MSRIGRMPVPVPAGVTVTVGDGNTVTVKGPKGELTRTFAHELGIEVKDGEVVVTRPNDLKRIKALHGLTRSLIHNMVVGTSEGYEKVLEINGVGYRAAKQGKVLTLNLRLLLTCLADLTSDMLLSILDTLALIRLRRTLGTDLGCILSNLLL